MVLFRRITVIASLIFIFANVSAADLTLVRLKYDGGDWYNDPECLNILAEYINRNTDLNLDTVQKVFEMKDKAIFDYPVLFMAGHGGLRYTDADIENMREYLLSGGFLYIDDDYGFRADAMRLIEAVFPDRKLVKLPADFEILNAFFDIDKLPKIHEHFKGAPEWYGVFVDEKLSVLYTYNTNISDGWAVYETHNDPESKRIEAMKMGTNIVYYGLFR